MEKSKYIKFVAKCILAALPLLAIVIFTLAFPMCYLDSEYPSWRYTKMVCSGELEADASVVILGDSRAMAALKPDVIEQQSGLKSVNLAVGGATSMEMYYFYKEYLKNNPAPEKTVIMFAPFHYSYIDNYDTRTVFFRTLKLSDAAQMYKNAAKSGAESVCHKGIIADEISCRLGLPNKYLPALVNSRFIGRRSDNEAIFDTLIANRGQNYFGTADGCSDLNYEANYKEMKTDNDAKFIDEYVNRLLELAAANSSEVLLCQPPMNESSFNHLDENYMNQYYNYLKSVAEHNPKVRVEEKIEAMEDKYFGDSSHLNAAGADMFSKEFADKYMK